MFKLGQQLVLGALAAVLTAMGWLLATAALVAALVTPLTPGGALAVVAALHLLIALILLARMQHGHRIVIARIERIEPPAREEDQPARPGIHADVLALLGTALLLLWKMSSPKGR